MKRHLKILSAVLLLSFAACKTKQAYDPITRSTLTSITFADITSIDFTRNDPTGGTNWSVRLERNAGQTDAKNNDLTWKILSTQLADTQAHSTLIDHLLDALFSGDIRSIAPETTLQSVGLDPPHYYFRIHSASKTEEIYVGEPWSQNNTRWVAFSKKGPALIAGGSFNRMLGHFTKESDLREPRIFPWDAADVQRITVTPRAPKQKWSAERRSGSWISVQSGKKLAKAKDFEAALEHLLHFRIERFENAFSLDQPPKPYATFEIESFGKAPFVASVYFRKEIDSKTKQSNAPSQSSALVIEVPSRNRMIFDVSESLLRVINEISKLSQ